MDVLPITASEGEHSDSHDDEPLLSHHGDGGSYESSHSGDIYSTSTRSLRVYKRRWYILLLFCLVGFSNYISWNTWDPIQSSAKFVYGWDDSIIALQADWGLITLIVLPPAFVIILNRFGLRVAEVVSVLCMFVGAAARLIETRNTTVNTILVNFGQLMNGVGGIVPLAGATMLTMTWFPDSERRTATAFATGTQQIGLALSFLLGPLIVPEPLIPPKNHTTINISLTPAGSNDATIEWDIQAYLWTQFIVVAILTILILIYFPNRPMHPPTLVSTTQRQELWPSLLRIISEPKFWFLSFTYGFFNGFFNSYLAVIAIDLAANERLAFSQFLSGWLGFATTVIGAVSGMLVANLADRLRASNPIRKMLLALLVCGLLTFSIFVFVVKGNYTFEVTTARTLIFTMILLTGASSASTVPLIFELGSDILYPISEEMIGSALVLIQNVIGLGILLVFMIPGVGTSWLDYTVLGGILFAIPMMLMLNDTNYRIDPKDEDEPSSSSMVT